MADWATKQREKAKGIPVIGGFLAALLPGNGDQKISTDFTSPTDLAEASNGFKVDYP